MNDQCPFCSSDDQCGCLRLLDSILPVATQCASDWWNSLDKALDYAPASFEDAALETAEAIVRERVKRYGPVRR
jgi:hypothetical protein